MQSLGRDSAPRSMALLGDADKRPAIVQNSGAPSAFLLLGDHAGREIPHRLGDLGVSRADLTRHIAWDIGVAGVGRHLARALDATFVRQRYSRLVIDCNRAPEKPDLIAEVSDGVAIPGNRSISTAQAQARHDEIYLPYHRRIARELDLRARRGQPTVVVSVHSFTPTMNGHSRPWRFGVLHKHDSPFSNAVLGLLREAVGEAAGDNQPYRMDEIDFTIPHHAGGRGLDYLELEIRQDLIAGPQGQRQIADLIAPLLSRALAGS